MQAAILRQENVLKNKKRRLLAINTLFYFVFDLFDIQKNTIASVESRHGTTLEYLLKESGQVGKPLAHEPNQTPIEQLKAAKLEMDKNSVLIRELERTYPPIKAYQPDPKVAGIKGAIMGTVLTIIILLLIRIFTNIVKELKSTDQAQS